MSNRKATFAKRQREQDLKDKARAKEAARAARASQPKVSKGPQIDWQDPNYLASQGLTPPDPPPPDRPAPATDDTKDD